MGAQNLCTLGEVRALMQKQSSRTEQNALIEALIPPASDAIMLYCERQFAPKAEASEIATLAPEAIWKTFEWPWEGELVSLAPYDLRGLPKKVLVDTDTVPELRQALYEAIEGGNGTHIAEAETALEKGAYVAEPNQWRLWPVPPRDGTTLSIRLRPYGAKLTAVMYRNRQVMIKGSWGFASVPDQVALACAQTVVHWLSVNAAVIRRPDDDPNIAHVPKRGIPPEACQLLDPFKRAHTA